MEIKMDIALKISKYLEKHADKRDENDSLNLVEGNIVGWDFVNVPMPTEQDLADAEAEIVALEARNSLLKAIESLEASITPRRVREALISGDKSFIEGVEAQIVALRGSL
jgi:hypothetical protein